MFQFRILLLSLSLSLSLENLYALWNHRTTNVYAQTTKKLELDSSN